MKRSLLKNGIVILTEEIPNAYSVSINLTVLTGSRHESKNESGISHFIEHLLFKGTESFPDPILITEKIESTGGFINAETTHESTSYWCKLPHEHLAKGLGTLFDMIKNPLFEKESVETERKVIIEELNNINDYPNDKADSLLDNLMWPGCGLGRDIGGTEKSINSINHPQIVKFFENNYIPNNIIVSIAGKALHQDIVNMASKLSEDMRCASIMHEDIFVSTQKTSQISVVHKDIDQVYLSMGYLTVSKYNNSKYILDLLGIILGEGMSSRLFNEIREKRGLAYEIEASTSYFTDSGVFQISAGLDKNKYITALTVILSELAKIQTNLTEKELEKAKSIISGRFKLKLEETKSVTDWNITKEISGQPNITDQEILNAYNSVDLSQIKNAATKYFNPNNANIILLGPCVNVPKMHEMIF
jgi:predicted Zn-dependent peptidase